MKNILLRISFFIRVLIFIWGIGEFFSGCTTSCKYWLPPEGSIQDVKTETLQENWKGVKQSFKGILLLGVGFIIFKSTTKKLE